MPSFESDQRRQYDMFGHESPGGSPFGPGGFQGVNINLDDLFSGGFESIFSGMFVGANHRVAVVEMTYCSGTRSHLSKF